MLETKNKLYKNIIYAILLFWDIVQKNVYLLFVLFVVDLGLKSYISTTLSEGYKNHRSHSRITSVMLVLVFLLMAGVGFAQCPQVTITNNLPDPFIICAGADTTFTVGYSPGKDFVIVPGSGGNIENSFTSTDTTFIPDYGNNCNNSCVYSNTITISGFAPDATITADTVIQYIRLNIQHTAANYLDIKLRCPDDQKFSSILRMGNVGDVWAEGYECVSTHAYIGWQGEDNVTDEYIEFGSVVSHDPLESPDPCEPGNWYEQMGSSPDNYCWSNNGTNGLVYRVGNVEGGKINPSYIDIDPISPLYMPDESFGNLNGCPLNGDWVIEIIPGIEESYGYLFDWEIVFDSTFIAQTTGGGSGQNITGMVVLDENGQEDSRFKCHFSDGDTSIVFTAPIVGSTITDTLRLFDSNTGCWYDTVLSIVVNAPEEGCSYLRSVCQGQPIELTANCACSRFNEVSNPYGDQWHSYHENLHKGPSGVEIASGSPYEALLGMFSSHSKVYPAGDKVKLGTGESSGQITTVAMDLSEPFTMDIRAKGWGKESNSNEPMKKSRVKVVVDKNSNREQVRIFDTEPTYYWPGDDAYRDYMLMFDRATNASTITVETDAPTGAYDRRVFLDRVAVTNGGCDYLWEDGSTDSTRLVTNAATLADAGTYTVTVTEDGCVRRVDTFVVTVNPEYHITETRTIAESELPYTWNNVTFTSAGTQSVTLQSVNECDSVVTMRLVIVPLPDNVDSAECTMLSTGHGWGLDVDWSSSEQVSTLVIPLVGDVTGDGIPEVVCFAPNSFYEVNQVQVFNTRTHEVIHTLSLSNQVSAVDASPYGIIKLPNGHVIFVAVMLNGTMEAYDLTAMSTSPLWTVEMPCIRGNVAFTDFNNDTYPEIYVGNRIYDAETGSLLIADPSITNEGGACTNTGESVKTVSSFAANVLGDERPELLLGNEIYEVSITNRFGIVGNSITLAASVIPPSEIGADGHAQVADFNMDGHLDVLVSNKATSSSPVGFYVWDVYNNTVSDPTVIQTFSRGKSVPLIADIDNDGLLEVVIQCSALSGGMVQAYKYNIESHSFSYMWGMEVDEDSWSNSMTMFDFNNDGQSDLLISDQSSVKIVNGSGHSHLTGNDTIPVYTLSSLNFGECTVMQYPIIADVDADGSAEIFGL